MLTDCSANALQLGCSILFIIHCLYRLVCRKNSSDEQNILNPGRGLSLVGLNYLLIIHTRCMSGLTCRTDLARIAYRRFYSLFPRCCRPSSTGRYLSMDASGFHRSRSYGEWIDSIYYYPWLHQNSTHVVYFSHANPSLLDSPERTESSTSVNCRRPYSNIRLRSLVRKPRAIVISTRPPFAIDLCESNVRSSQSIILQGMVGTYNA